MKNYLLFALAGLLLFTNEDVSARPRSRQNDCPPAQRTTRWLNFRSWFPVSEERFAEKKKEEQPEQVTEKQADRSKYYVKRYKFPRQRFHERGWRKWVCR